MKKNEFLDRCCAQASGALKPYIVFAFESAESCFGIGDDGPYGKEYSQAEISKVIQLAGKLHRLAEQNREEYKSEPDILLNINPETIITSEELIKDITPTIREVRKALFAKEDPPFPNNLAKAIAWLKKQVRKEARTIIKETSNTGVSMDMINRLINQAQMLDKAMPNGECSVTIRKLTIPYQGKDGRIRKLPVFKGKFSETLSQITKGLSEKTNFSQIDLLTFLLTGIRPMLPCMRIRRGIAWYPSVQVDIYRSLNYKEAASLVRNVNRTLKPTKKELTSRHLELYQFVARNGGVPGSKKREFWERLQKKWNRKYPDRRFGSWKCIHIAYSRILKSLRIKKIISSSK